jgi:CDP-diglyceride synthetase
MRDKFTLFVVVGKAALMATFGYAAFGYAALVLLGFKAATIRTGQGVLVIAGALLPNGFAAWWMFRELQKQYSRRESQAVATAFGVVTPLSLAVAAVLSQIPGAYAEAVLGRRFILPAIFVSVTVVTTLLGFAASAFVLQFTRHLEKAEHPQSHEV